VRAVEQHNVLSTMNMILDESPTLRALFENGEIGISGAYYDVDTGEVEFMKEAIAEPVAG